MTSPNDRMIGMLRRVSRDCERLFADAATRMMSHHPTLIRGRVADFPQLMDDLHRGLLIKIYVTIVRADQRWSGPEKLVAAELIDHLWGERLSGNPLREAATALFAQSDRLGWASLLNPFVQYEPLANYRSQIETIVMRLANLVAKCDGQTMPAEAQALHELQHVIDQTLHPVGGKPDAPAASPLPIGGGRHRPAPAGPRTRTNAAVPASRSPQAAASEESMRQRLEAALAELDGLIGLDSVKQRIRSTTNFLRLQQQRRVSGLSTMPIGLHMVFSGNPGTGKTTVARIVGQILGGLGMLRHGHVVETDRSGLVAEYAGQTAVKTNQLIDSAIGGVLFIDEAYTLIDTSGDDAYGREAVAVLLKRMEDDRDQLSVILAGYTAEMKRTIQSNPGLQSRINTQIDFEDYCPRHLGQIFEALCDRNQYQLPADARHRLLLGLDRLHRDRDRHFGNGRLVRNAFEDSVRSLADRVADVTTLTEDLLITLTAQDIQVPGISSSQWDTLLASTHRLRLTCGGCDKQILIDPKSLGRGVRCTGCGHVQPTPWADVAYEDVARRKV